jgi:acetamidase/formamidase
MPKLLFVTVPTDEVLNKEGKVRFPGTDAAVEALTEVGWEVEVCEPTWPKPLEVAKAGDYAAILVSTFKAVPRSRDAASMLARMQGAPVYTVGVLQKDDAFRTMAPTVGVLRNIRELEVPQG